MHMDGRNMMHDVLGGIWTREIIEKKWKTARSSCSLDQPYNGHGNWNNHVTEWEFSFRTVANICTGMILQTWAW